MTDGEAPAPPAARINRPLAASYLCVFLFAVGEGALHVLVPPCLATERQLSPGSVGGVVAVFGLASLLTRLPVGAAYTPARARLLLVVGGGMSAAAFALVPLVDSTAAFAALMAVDGVGWALATTIQLVVLVSAPQRLDGIGDGLVRRLPGPRQHRRGRAGRGRRRPLRLRRRVP